MKTGRNEPCPCDSGKKYKKCCLERDMEKDNATGEGLPVYKCWISNPKGSRIVVISRNKHNDNFQIVSLLVDEWKMGLKDGFGNYNMTKKQLNEYIEAEDFRETTLEECKKLIKKGVLIAESLGFRLPREYEQYKGIVGTIDDIEMNGSLYKCYSCGQNDLDEKTVCRIKEITRKDVKDVVCGTPDETKIYFICDQCKEKRKTNINSEEDDDAYQTQEDNNFWEEDFFAETIDSEDIKAKMRTFDMGHNEEMEYNCKKCNSKISAHNKDWHAELCDAHFDEESFEDGK